jgi:hypothetical protein
MRIGEEVHMASCLSDEPYSHSSGDDVHEVRNDLASGVEFQDNGRLDVETEENGANGHQQNPSESGEDAMNDNNTVDALQSEACAEIRSSPTRSRL